MNFPGRILGKARRVLTAVPSAVKWVLLALLTLITEHTLGVPVVNWIDRKARERRAPQEQLARADSMRHRWTEVSLNAAVTTYKRVLTGTPDRKHEAYVGLSRTYADWFFLRVQRGLYPGSLSLQALEHAVRASESSRPDKDTHTAMGFADYAQEYSHVDKDRTKSAVAELRARKYTGPEVDYLSWVSGAFEDPRSYISEMDPELISELPILTDVTLELLSVAQRRSGKRRDRLLSEAQLLLRRAESIYGLNPLVLYARGYNAAVNGNVVQAQEHLQRALTEEPDFPNARNELGYVYASVGDYKAARQQFEEASRSLAAPGPLRSVWLNNLGVASLEVDDRSGACRAWHQAAEIPGASENPFTLYGLAICSYLDGQDEAAPYFLRAVETGKNLGYDFSTLEAFKGRKAGPRELQVAKALIALAIGQAGK